MKSLKAISRYMNIDKKEIPLFFAFLCAIPIGETVSFVNGRVRKLDETTIQLLIDQETIEQVVEDFQEETITTYRDMFGHDPVDDDDEFYN